MVVSKIELQECLRDSPKFRSSLDEEESSVDQLENKLERILKVCGSMVDAGKTYVGQQSLFANSLWDLSTHFKEDPMVLSSLNKLIHSLQEMNKFHTILLDQASRTILKNVTSFIKNDIKQVRDYKQHFEKISSEYDNVLIRNSHTPRNKQQEVEEVQNILVAVRSCFGHQTLDYVNSISILQAKKRHEILSTLLSYMHACTAYYHQGSDLCADLEPFFKTLADEEPALYTGHCLRRSSATLLANAGANMTTLKRHGGWKSSTVAEGYLEESVHNKIQIAEKIQDSNASASSSTISSCTDMGASGSNEPTNFTMTSNSNKPLAFSFNFNINVNSACNSNK